MSCLVFFCVSFNGSITSVGKERANFSIIDYSLLCGSCSEIFHLPLGV